MSDQHSRKEFVGLRGTPTPDGGMLIEIGEDPAGSGPVNIIPMFMKRPAGTNFAQAIELTDMGEYGRPKVKNEGYQDVLEAKSMIMRAMQTLQGVDKNWPLMILIREMERLAQATPGELPTDEGAQVALGEACQNLLDHMYSLEFTGR